jgi:hypothetical protein
MNIEAGQLFIKNCAWCNPPRSEGRNKLIAENPKAIITDGICKPHIAEYFPRQLPTTEKVVFTLTK